MMVCVPCIVIPFLLWFFHRYLRPIVEKCCPSMLKYLPGNSNNTEKETGGKCPFKDSETKSNENDTNSKTEVTSGDGGSKKTN